MKTIHAWAPDNDAITATGGPHVLSVSTDQGRPSAVAATMIARPVHDAEVLPLTGDSYRTRRRRLLSKTDSD